MRPDNSTKVKIRKIALTLFKERGFDNVTINDICEESGISKHTFYYYFASKEGLLKTVMTLPDDLSSDEVAKLMMLDSPYQQYCEILKKRIRHFESCGKDIVKKILVARLTVSFDEQKEKEDFTEERPFLEMQIGFIKKAQERGEIGNMGEPKNLMHAAFCVLIGISQVWATHPGTKFDLEKEYFKILDTVMMKKVDKNE
ncbi:TetR/AcrR family transcriptional regulator [Anaerorhabdus furcosa]|uniref:Transcriptional regulator, TetR family n=1 Tax=Anaerorhabdus furcosa TaxID=118967 RepID=A0A1T4KA60_9FIRM|nr:TetR/AcrR family transcriptional regulator [Anaerorhabdus furcosa]SJZ39330.1 transcriptional regulator, TetR family [Anaerorhabdus furcosa]